MNPMLNDLFDYGYKIYQDDNYFKFSLDSVILAEFVNIKKNKYKVMDLCSGNAPIPMILNLKYNGQLDISAIELQKDIYELGKMSLEYNKIDNINYINADAREYYKTHKEKYDVITCNPPYFVVTDDKMLNDNNIKAIARHEICFNLEDLFLISSKMLENNGYLYFIHSSNRLGDIFDYSSKYNFGIKRIVPLYGNKKSSSNLVLVEVMFNGKNYVSIEQPIFINEYSSYQNIF